MRQEMTVTRKLRRAALSGTFLAAAATIAAATPNGPPIALKDQGSFMVGGTVVTNPGTFDPIALTPDGQTIHNNVQIADLLSAYLHRKGLDSR